MYRVDAYIRQKVHANISKFDIKREWMDNTFKGHAYHCFPIGLANQLGWSLSFPEDISFIWDGISDSSPDHVKVISGNQYVYTERANATISFKTGIVLKTDSDISLLHMPSPNFFIDGVQAFTTLISSSFYEFEFPCAMMITKPNETITIKANQPVISILPINLNYIQGSELFINNYSSNDSFDHLKYGEEITNINLSGKWSDFYRNAVDHTGKHLGSHQEKKLNFNVIVDKG